MSPEELMETPEDIKEPQEEMLNIQEEVKEPQEEVQEPHEELVETQEEKGTVKWFDARKHYDFIERDKGGDIFVHANGMADSFAHALEDGERVRFIVGQGPKGPAAQEVHRLS